MAQAEIAEVLLRDRRCLPSPKIAGTAFLLDLRLGRGELLERVGDGVVEALGERLEHAADLLLHELAERIALDGLGDAALDEIVGIAGRDVDAFADGFAAGRLLELDEHGCWPPTFAARLSWWEKGCQLSVVSCQLPVVSSLPVVDFAD